MSSKICICLMQFSKRSVLLELEMVFRFLLLFFLSFLVERGNCFLCNFD